MTLKRGLAWRSAIVTGFRWAWSRSSCNNAGEPGKIGPRHRFSGRKPMILAAHQRQMRTLLNQKPDLTLKELRAGLELDCSLPAIHYVLAKMGLTYKKRHSMPASKTVRTLRGRAAPGGVGKAVWTRPN